MYVKNKEEFEKMLDEIVEIYRKMKWKICGRIPNREEIREIILDGIVGLNRPRVTMTSTGRIHMEKDEFGDYEICLEGWWINHDLALELAEEAKRSRN